MFNLSVPWWEFVVRGAAVYFFLIAMLRLTGTRQVGQLAPIDLILLLILSNAVQNSMNAGDNSLIGGLISATTLIALNWLVSYSSFRNPKLEALIDGQPLVLVRDGIPVQKILDQEQITKAELETALRLAGVFDVKEVKVATLEPNGHISVCNSNSS
jgi:uncharacterized membrane protein YcaP (DUF421 family)